MSDERTGGAANWGACPYDYESGRITVTITLAEYRELVGKAALYDEDERARREFAEGHDGTANG